MNPRNAGRDGPLMSLVLPAYNPGLSIDLTWRHLAEFLHTTPGNWEILFVCDGCTDGTPGRLHELAAAESHRVQILSHTPNRGKGFAVRRGLEAARGSYRLFTDVDLAYGFDDIQRVAAALRAGSDVAIASRVHPGSRLLMPSSLQGYAYRRHLQSLVFSTVVRCLLPLSFRDTQAGLKGITAQAARLLLPRLQCDGFGLDCELLVASVCQGLTIAEVPVCVRYEDRASTTGIQTMGRMVREIWRIRQVWGHQRPAETTVTLPPTRREAA